MLGLLGAPRSAARLPLRCHGSCLLYTLENTHPLTPSCIPTHPRAVRASGAVISYGSERPWSFTSNIRIVDSTETDVQPLNSLAKTVEGAFEQRLDQISVDCFLLVQNQDMRQCKPRMRQRHGEVAKNSHSRIAITFRWTFSAHT